MNGYRFAGRTKSGLTIFRVTGIDLNSGLNVAASVAAKNKFQAIELASMTMRHVKVVA